MPNAGRKNKCTYLEVKRAIRDYGEFTYKICEVLDISLHTLYRYFHQYPDLKEYARRRHKWAARAVAGRVHRLIMEGDLTDPVTARWAMRFLENARPKEFGRAKKESTTIGQVNILNNEVPLLTDDKKREILERVKGSLAEKKPLEIGLKELPTPQESPIIIENAPSQEGPCQLLYTSETQDNHHDSGPDQNSQVIEEPPQTHADPQVDREGDSLRGA